MFVRENNGTNMVKFRKIYFCKRAEFFRSLEPIKYIYIYIYIQFCLFHTFWKRTTDLSFSE